MRSGRRPASMFLGGFAPGTAADRKDAGSEYQIG